MLISGLWLLSDDVAVSGVDSVMVGLWWIYAMTTTTKTTDTRL